MGLVREDYPPELVRVAERRTHEHLHGMRLVDFDLRQLLVNVYLQGVRDAAEVAANAAERKPT